MGMRRFAKPRSASRPSSFFFLNSSLRNIDDQALALLALETPFWRPRDNCGDSYLAPSRRVRRRAMVGHQTDRSIVNAMIDRPVCPHMCHSSWPSGWWPRAPPHANGHAAPPDHRGPGMPFTGETSMRSAALPVRSPAVTSSRTSCAPGPGLGTQTSNPLAISLPSTYHVA